MSTDKEMELTKELEKLREENKRLRECIEFYANIESWNVSEKENFSEYLTIDRVDIGDGDFETKNGQCDDRGVGGKLARQTLKEIGE